MDYKDFILTPFVLLLIYAIAYIIRSTISKDNPRRKYFIPGLSVRIIGAIATGLIYKFYYKGGDTFTFYQGTEIIWKAFLEDPWVALKIIFGETNSYSQDTFRYTQYIWTYRDPGSFMVVRIASFIGLFCFNTYSVISLTFAVFSFIGTWNLYKVFTSIMPDMHKEFAIAILFLPSVFFWGSGLFKDTITYTCLAWLTYSIYMIFIKKSNIISNSIALLICSYFIMVIKTYILLSFLPPVMFWIFLHYKGSLPSKFLQRMITPMLILFSVGISYLLINQLGEEFERYSLTNILDSASSMQRWHSYVSRNDQGAGYDLGINSGNPMEILSIIPSAINVTLFRPYLWEIRNVVMLLTALESIFILGLTLFVLIKCKFLGFFKIILSDPVILFCILFTLVFAFAVGFSTYNFGALARYKIPCLPFYVAGLYIIYYKRKVYVRLQKHNVS